MGHDPSLLLDNGSDARYKVRTDFFKEMFMSKIGALILAAGKGTRMHSIKPKVLQNLLGEPMLHYVLDALRPLMGEAIWTVIGHQAQMVRAAFSSENLNFVEQEQQLGTGHALMQAMPALREAQCSHVLVVNGDTPLVSTALIERFLAQAQGAELAFATLVLPEAGAYGRVVRQGAVVRAIVEAKDYDPAVYGPEPREVNAGLYYFSMELLEKMLPNIGCVNNSGEYYLTDVVALAVEAQCVVRGVECGHEPHLLGVNSPLELAEAEAILRAQVVQSHLQAGVIMHAPESIRISPRAVVEPGAELFGPVEIYGQSRIAQGAKVESHCVLHNAVVDGGACVHNFSHITDAYVGERASVGPYGRLRPQAHMEADSHLGNFVELKKARLCQGAKANHLSYIGDAVVGAKANIGAGTITCNYDGKNKFVTTIGAGAFIGSNTALVAPVTVGDNALIGAGSVITKDVPASEMGIGRAKQKNMPLRKKD